MNVVALEHGLIGCFGIVGGSIAAATGAALAFSGSGRAAVAFFGDGAVNQAYFYECLNYAKVFSLPALYVCENNLYGEYTRSDLVTAGGVQARAEVMEIPSQTVDGNYHVYQFTGDPDRTRNTARKTQDWVREVQQLGAGEIVLNCMASDGVRKGYDLEQLSAIRKLCKVPLIASGGAGTPEHFRDVFDKAHVDGALAASVFHTGSIAIPNLKQYLRAQSIEIRP
jgi:imidazoleglycerol phosphate synthase cyclase subunit